MLVTARPVGVLVSTPSRRDLTYTPRVVSSCKAVATSRTDRPSRSTAATTRWSPSRSQPMHSVQPGRLLPARPDAVSVNIRSGTTPAAAMRSCCWSTDCCPVDTRRYTAILITTYNNRCPTIHPVSDRHPWGGLVRLSACETMHRRRMSPCLTRT